MFVVIRKGVEIGREKKWRKMILLGRGALKEQWEEENEKLST